MQKFGLGVPHYRLEQHIEGQGLSLDRGMMSRYADEAGGALGASIVRAMWQDAIATVGVISTDATGAMIQPEKREDGQRQSCKKGHFFTAVVDCDHVLFAYTEHHTQEAVRKLFGDFKYWPSTATSSSHPSSGQPQRGNLNPVELKVDLCSFTVPPARSPRSGRAPTGAYASLRRTARGQERRGRDSNPR